MNQSYGAKFGSFQLACNAQEARRQGLSEGARRMAAAQDQCYENQTRNGASPTQAYQTCANDETLGPIAAELPAAKSIVDFIRDHTNMQLTPTVAALFGLLPEMQKFASATPCSASLMATRPPPSGIVGRKPTSPIRPRSMTLVCRPTSQEWFNPPRFSVRETYPAAANNSIVTPWRRKWQSPRHAARFWTSCRR
jgi:hypothetical protein